MRTNGIGINSSAMNPNSELAQREFNLVYICPAKSGNPAPAQERSTVVAASAEADTARYASDVARPGYISET